MLTAGRPSLDLTGWGLLCRRVFCLTCFLPYPSCSRLLVLLRFCLVFRQGSGTKLGDIPIGELEHHTFLCRVCTLFCRTSHLLPLSCVYSFLPNITPSLSCVYPLLVVVVGSLLLLLRLLLFGRHCRCCCCSLHTCLPPLKSRMYLVQNCLNLCAPRPV